ncbi:hypothetical protein EYF80_004671 [Liparis tanakae]|uniref:Uncharacterized protein n=1 Tax=Liparis tanakae TaxID=230148 RepID=A0A4Z2J4S1_9TELE|nr:hypothetical protein EYF80_004671 [Liparis tanakae]
MEFNVRAEDDVLGIPVKRLYSSSKVNNSQNLPNTPVAQPLSAGCPPPRRTAALPKHKPHSAPGETGLPPSDSPQCPPMDKAREA